MSYVSVGEENGASIDIYYEDHGSGKPVVLIHGFPLSGRSWEKQVPALLDAGYRVIAYDRRGFGRSSQPVTGYEFDTFAQDLHRLIMKLDLRGVTLTGFSLGACEVAHYLGTYGSERVSGAIIIDGVPPFVVKAPDNPEGVDRSVFDEMVAAMKRDRLAYLSTFLAAFYNVDVLMGDRVSEEVVRDSWNIAAGASPIGTAESLLAGCADFRDDLSRIDVPTLVIHGDADRILPIEVTGMRTQKAIKGSQFVVVKGGPHGLCWTHAEQVNRELLRFLQEQAMGTRGRQAA